MQKVVRTHGNRAGSRVCGSVTSFPAVDAAVARELRATVCDEATGSLR